MNEFIYQKIHPEGLFTVTVERKEVSDTRWRLHYEFSYTIAHRETPCDFINLFADLLIRHGKCRVSFYARQMGMAHSDFSTTLRTLSGASVSEWIDACVQTLVEALLRETNWPVGKVAEAAGFGRLSIFSTWFLKKYKCPPRAWR